MELKFMTPSEVWEDYDPAIAPLERSTVSTEESADLAHTVYAFDVDYSEQTHFKAHISVYFDKRWQDARSAVLLLPTLDDLPLDRLIDTLIQEGYVVGVPDYAGKRGTEFPQSLSFASDAECKRLLDVLEDSARRSPWYVWCKIARRALTLLYSLTYVDSARIAVMGIGVGGHISWQVAAMDKRVKALIPICGGGYRWAKDKPRFTHGNVPETEQEIAYSTGVGAETYAKLVTCPTFYLTTRMSQFCDVDRAGDILSFVRSSNKKLLIMRSLDMQITNKGMLAVLSWLRATFAGTYDAPTPTMSFEAADGELYLRLDTAKEALSVQVYSSYGEAYAFARNWTKLEGLQQVGAHEYTVHVPVYDPASLTLAYASVLYSDDDACSTSVTGIIPQKLGASNVEAGNECSRIIFDNSMDIDIFSVKTEDAVLESGLLSKRKGPFDIEGVSVSEGSLMLCRSERELNAFARTSALHFDVYSPQENDLEIRVYTVPDEKCYIARTQLLGGEFWQKVLVSATDFKSEEGRTLTKFGGAKVISLWDAKGLIFNNFLWI